MKVYDNIPAAAKASRVQPREIVLCEIDIIVNNLGDVDELYREEQEYQNIPEKYKKRIYDQVTIDRLEDGTRRISALIV